jgi:hypothetical protein
MKAQIIKKILKHRSNLNLLIRIKLIQNLIVCYKETNIGFQIILRSSINLKLSTNFS